MGASFALKMKSKGHSISGVVRTSASKKILQEKGLENVVLPDNDQIPDFLRSAQVLVFATPVEEIFHIAKRFNHFIEFENLQLITDMSSTKESIMLFMDKSLEYIPFIGSHPMAGSENNGPGFADAQLFQGSSVYITPSEKLSQMNSRRYAEAERILIELWHETGSKTIRAKAADHDRWLAYLSHGLHIIACACATMTDSIPEVRNLPSIPVGGSFRDMTRVAVSLPSLWEGIIDSNRKNTIQYLNEMIHCLSEWKGKLEEDNLDIKAIFQKASASREKILKDT